MLVIGEENYWQGRRADCEFYSRFRPPYQDIVVPWTIDFYQSCRRPHSNHHAKIPLALDVGCGPGQVSAALSPHCARVLAVDTSDDMLAVARHHRPRPNVEYRHGSALNLSEMCGDHQVDLLVTSASVHVFDTPKFYAEAERVLKPNGVLAMLCYTMKGFCHHDDQSLRTAIEDFLVDEAKDERVREILLLDHGQYKLLNTPFPVALRQREDFYVEVSRETVYGILMSFTGWIRDESAVVTFLDSLPNAWPLTMVSEAFGVFARMKSS